MNTPIADFVKKYAEKSTARFHMPGHKGQSFLGIEKYDITEIDGADVLSQADGIIDESENNATKLFGTAHTYYCAGGATAVVCGMLALVKREDTLILAARNVHKAFINACALLDYDVEWICEKEISTVLKCTVTAKNVEEKILSARIKPAAVYLTSPDYLGNIQNISEIGSVCKRYGIPLLVDNAHGAYLGFLEKSLHPIHLGATLCCDSAHKTLPVLTGGAYLHIAKNALKDFLENARNSLALFTSTSPSYLILQSLDLCNRYLAENAKKELNECIRKINKVKSFIAEKGFIICKSEPLKIVIDANLSGYTGKELAGDLRSFNAEPEFYDDRFVVLMITPQNRDSDFEILRKAFSSFNAKRAVTVKTVKLSQPVKRMSIRSSVFAKSETVVVKDCIGRICAAPTVSCPPAIPIAISGEEITKEVADLLALYGVQRIRVVKSENNIKNP